MPTKKEFYQYLAKKGALKKFLVNWKIYKTKYKVVDYLKSHGYSIINVAWTWSSTQEGHDYWSELHWDYMKQKE